MASLSSSGRCAITVSRRSSIGTVCAVVRGFPYPTELWEQVNAVSGDVTELPPRAEPPELLKFETSPTPDPHFPEGWDGAMRMALADPSWAERISKEMNVETEFRTTVSEVEQRLFSLGDPVPTAEEPSTRPVSVTGLVTYAQCPRRFYWSEVDPLPRRVNPAAVRGTEIHRRIELHQKGIVPLAVDDVPMIEPSFARTLTAGADGPVTSSA